MGKGGKKRPALGTNGPPTKIARSSRGGFVTVGAMSPAPTPKPVLFKHKSIAAPMTTTAAAALSKGKANVLAGSDLSEHAGRVWRRSHEKLDEAVYHLSLSEPQPLLVVVDDEAQVLSLHATLKILYPPHESAKAVHTVAVTLKTARKALEKTLRKSMHSQRGIIAVTRECVNLAKSCLPVHVRCKTVVHASSSLPTAAEVAARSELCLPSGKTGGKASSANTSNHVFLVASGSSIALSASSSSSSSRSSRSLPIFEVQRRWMPCLQARCSAARKLATAMQQGNTVGWSGGDRDAKALEKAMEEPRGGREQTPEGQALAGRVEGLRAKLKIAMSTPLPGARADVADSIGTDATTATPTPSPSADAASASSSAPIPAPTSCSSKSRRVRMECLGMVHTLSQEERRFQAQTGRTLAATRWLDGKTCKAVFAESEAAEGKAAWDEVRFGASVDSVAATARTIVEGFRDFVAMRTKKSGQKLPKREDEAQLVEGLSAGHREALAGSRITALGWRPSPFGEGDAWGGKYGKCCAHNEVALFYTRPFFPQEVLNTHICSKASPAPGNEGYDGCLEFIVAQCTFYKKAMTVWDDRFFHYISAQGVHSKVDKSELILKYSESELKVLVKELREWTIRTGGQYTVLDFMKTWNFVSL